MPEDGIFHATTITIGEGVSLRFNRNARNTPVYLLATGRRDVGLQAVWIDVDWRKVESRSSPGNPAEGGFGGPGGYDGGAGWVIGKDAAGSGLGPGGGRGRQRRSVTAGDAAHGDMGIDSGRPKGVRLWKRAPDPAGGRFRRWRNECGECCRGFRWRRRRCPSDRFGHFDQD